MKNFAWIMGILLVLLEHIPAQNLGKLPPLPHKALTIPSVDMVQKVSK